MECTHPPYMPHGRLLCTTLWYPDQHPRGWDHYRRGLRKIIASSKPLPNDGEYDLTFDQWHQGWRRLLKLITEFILEEYHAWNIHFTSIRDKVSRPENWKLWVMYDTELRRQSVTSSVDPSRFHPDL